MHIRGLRHIHHFGKNRIFILRDKLMLFVLLVFDDSVGHLLQRDRKRLREIRLFHPTGVLNRPIPEDRAQNDENGRHKKTAESSPVCQCKNKDENAPCDESVRPQQTHKKRENKEKNPRSRRPHSLTAAAVPHIDEQYKNRGSERNILPHRDRVNCAVRAQKEEHPAQHEKPPRSKFLTQHHEHSLIAHA